MSRLRACMAHGSNQRRSTLFQTIMIILKMMMLQKRLPPSHQMRLADLRTRLLPTSNIQHCLTVLNRNGTEILGRSPMGVCLNHRSSIALVNRLWERTRDCFRRSPKIGQSLASMNPELDTTRWYPTIPWAGPQANSVSGIPTCERPADFQVLLPMS